MPFAEGSDRYRVPLTMTNRLALILGLLILGFVGADLVFDWGATLFLARRFADLVEWLAFWR
jgi:hypothetical protein